MKKTLLSVIPVLAFAMVTTQAVAPSLSYEISGNELIINYTGTLLQSADAVNWTEIASASSPYQVALGDKKLFFCAKASDEPVDPLVPGKNGTVSLPGGVYLDLNWIEPGTFTMGSPESEIGGYSDETQHSVTISHGFWIGKYEVTQAQYKAIMKVNPSEFMGADLPVECVTWDDAMEFCKKLTKIEKAAGRLPEGYEYTLPTEAQWEYACRAGTTTALNSGKNLSDEEKCPEMDEVGWYQYNSGFLDSNGNWTDNGKTFSVGQKKPNAWGLYDMHGNVYEWCLDWYGDYPASSVMDPQGASTGSFRVIRGGGWISYAYSCRSAYRGYYYPDDRDYCYGFRVALAPVK